MMADQIDKTTAKSTRSGSKPRITKLFRHRSYKIEFLNPLTSDSSSSPTIHTSIGFPNRTSTIGNQTGSVISGNSIGSSKKPRALISGTKSVALVLPRSQSNRSKIENYMGKNDLEEKSKQSSEPTKEHKENNELKEERIFSTSTMTRYQDSEHGIISIDKCSDLKQSTNRLSSQMNFLNEHNKESNKKNRSRRKAAGKPCGCSRLCIFFTILAGILIGAALAAALISVLNKTNTTNTILTTTTTITTITTTSSATTTSVSTTSTTISTTTTTVSITTTTVSTTTTTVSTTTTTSTSTTDSTTTTTSLMITVTYTPSGIWDLKIPTCATWNPNGITVAGNSNGTAGSDLASLNATVSIFVDNNYTLYVCDRENHRILRYPFNSTNGTIVAGDGTPGNSSTQLFEPKGVAVDQEGSIIVGDSSNYRIQRFPVGSLVGTTVAFNSSVNLLGQTRDLHIDVNNNIYVTDSDYSRIVKFYPNNGIGVILAGSAGSGSGSNELNEPYGNFIDGNQTLFIADWGNHRIQRWLPGASNGTTVAGVTNSPGSNLLKLRRPRAVITDNNGYIYIADSNNHRIVRWTTNYTAGGTCIVGCSGSSGFGPTELDSPRDLKFDASGNLYVSDQGNNRVQMYAIQIPPNCTSSG